MLYYSKYPDPSDLSIADLKQKFGILNAFYLPDVDNDILYPTITPVNTFRVVFNLYFEAILNYYLMRTMLPTIGISIVLLESQIKSNRNFLLLILY